MNLQAIPLKSNWKRSKIDAKLWIVGMQRIPGTSIPIQIPISQWLCEVVTKKTKSQEILPI